MTAFDIIICSVLATIFGIVGYHVSQYFKGRVYGSFNTLRKMGAGDWFEVVAFTALLTVLGGGAGYGIIMLTKLVGTLVLLAIPVNAAIIFSYRYTENVAAFIMQIFTPQAKV